MNSAAKFFGINLKPRDSKIHKYSQEPDKAWQELKLETPVHKIDPLRLDTPIREDKIRIVCISDTHSKLQKVTVPPGDILIHGGDFTNMGSRAEVNKFNDIIGKLPHGYKIVIAGNHELTFDKKTSGRAGIEDPEEMKRLLTNCTYLEDSSIVCYGLKIYGSPHQPVFMGWAFNVRRGKALIDIWNKIPTDTDVLITHGPPVGFGDVCRSGDHVGCVELLHTVRHRVKPKYHIFGHIHEGYGIESDGTTVYVNASTCTASYRPENPPIILDVDIPPGFTKKEAVSMVIEPKNFVAGSLLSVEFEDKLEIRDEEEMEGQGEEESERKSVKKTEESSG